MDLCKYKIVDIVFFMRNILFFWMLNKVKL